MSQQPGFYELLGARARAVREERGWTQDQLAQAVGIEPATLSRYETARNAFTLDVLRRIAGALNVELIALLDIGRKVPRPKDVPPPPEMPSRRARGKEEQAILAAWRRLTPKNRDLALRIVLEIGRRK